MWSSLAIQGLQLHFLKPGNDTDNREPRSPHGAITTARGATNTVLTDKSQQTIIKNHQSSDLDFDRSLDNVQNTEHTILNHSKLKKLIDMR